MWMMTWQEPYVRPYLTPPGSQLCSTRLTPSSGGPNRWYLSIWPLPQMLLATSEDTICLMQRVCEMWWL